MPVQAGRLDVAGVEPPPPEADRDHGDHDDPADDVQQVKPGDAVDDRGRKRERPRPVRIGEPEIAVGEQDRAERGRVGEDEQPNRELLRLDAVRRLLHHGPMPGSHGRRRFAHVALPTDAYTRMTRIDSRYSHSTPMKCQYSDAAPSALLAPGRAARVKRCSTYVKPATPPSRCRPCRAVNT